MGINDIMTNGKIDGQKMYQFSENSPAESWEDFDMFADSINAHIDGLKPQETPITAARLEAAGFTVERGRANGKIYESYTKQAFKFIDGYVYIMGAMLPHIKTMEQLATAWGFYSSHPLTWVTPYERTVKELEAMGFVDSGRFFTRTVNASKVCVYFEGEVLETVFVEKSRFYGVKTTAQLRELLALLEGKNE